MAQTATRRSEVRQQRGAQTARPRPATKPVSDSQPASRSKRSGNVPSGSAATRSRRSSGSDGVGKVVRRSAGKALAPGGGVGSKLVRLVIKRIARHELNKLRDAAAERIEKARERFPALDAAALNSLTPRLPIQQSIDVAVPLEFAWQAWTELHFLPEGVGRVVDITREGDELTGRLVGVPARSWRAEVQDERDGESFAWLSNEGSDCAGLVTFHRLSDRLTRIELDLDVVPTNVTETVLLLTHLAHRRTSAEMRRMKAGLEFVSPDVYAGDG